MVRTSMKLRQTDAQIVLSILQREGLYNLTSSDGCLCAHIELRFIKIDVHCWKSAHDDCQCRWAGIHLTPHDFADVDELVAIGELIRAEIARADMNVKIIIHSPSSEHENRPLLVFDAPTPEGGFQFGESSV